MSRESTFSPKLNPATGLPWRLRAPREVRIVSAVMPSGGTRRRSAKRRVPQIRLSGAWLERIGFAHGARFLVLIEDANQILLALVDP